MEFVARVGTDPRQIAATIVAGISDEQRRAWSQGTVSDWVMESFTVTRKDAYGALPEPGTRGVYVLDGRYTVGAIRDVGVQLSPTGVRLAVVLNRALSTP